MKRKVKKSTKKSRNKFEPVIDGIQMTTITESQYQELSKRSIRLRTIEETCIGVVDGLIDEMWMMKGAHIANELLRTSRSIQQTSMDDSSNITIYPPTRRERETARKTIMKLVFGESSTTVALAVNEQPKK